jgi:hypothetical protein
MTFYDLLDPAFDPAFDVDDLPRKVRDLDDDRASAPSTRCVWCSYTPDVGCDQCDESEAR